MEYSSYQNEIESLRKSCFFCSEPLGKDKTQEHIIPNSLLERFDIKESTINSFDLVRQYSKIKIPAHAKCNNKFGGKYENAILRKLKNPETLYEDLISEEGSNLLRYSPGQSTSQAITVWLMKVYYGLYYYDLLRNDQRVYTDLIFKHVDWNLFSFVQLSYLNENAFAPPSSLFVFKSNSYDFDLLTHMNPNMILLKAGYLVMILVIGDCYFSKNYLSLDMDNLRSALKTMEDENPTNSEHRKIWAEIVAFRYCVPKIPTYLNLKDEIVVIDMDFMNTTKIRNRYPIDSDCFISNKRRILNLLSTDNGS